MLDEAEDFGALLDRGDDGRDLFASPRSGAAPGDVDMVPATWLNPPVRLA